MADTYSLHHMYICTPDALIHTQCPHFPALWLLAKRWKIFTFCKCLSMFRSLSRGDLCSPREGGHIIYCGATQFIYAKCDKLTQLTCPLATEPASSGTICIPNFWATRSTHIFLKPQKCFLFHPNFTSRTPSDKEQMQAPKCAIGTSSERRRFLTSPFNLLLASCKASSRSVQSGHHLAPLVVEQRCCGDLGSGSNRC